MIRLVTSIQMAIVQLPSVGVFASRRLRLPQQDGASLVVVALPLPEVS